MKHKNTQPLYIFNRENPQNSEPQNDPRSGLDYTALVKLYLIPKDLACNYASKLYPEFCLILYNSQQVKTKSPKSVTSIFDLQ